MSNTNDSIQRLITFSYWYVKKSKNLFDYLLNPILNFVGSYSLTMKKSLENILNPIYKFIITLPVFLPILIGVAYAFNDITSIYMIEYEIYNVGLTTIQTRLSIIIMCLSVFTGVLFYYVNNKSIKTSLITFLSIFASSIPVLYLEPPNLYVYIVTIIFAIGAYSTTYIQFKNYTPINTILNKKETHHAGVGYVFFYALIMIPMMYAINVQYFSDNITFSLTIVLGIIGYSLTYIQEGLYKEVYENMRLNKSSRVFLYPARISVVYATGVTIINQYVSLITFGLYFVPSFTFMAFYIYITSTKDGYSTTKKVEDENMYNSMGVNMAYGSDKPVVNQLDCNITRMDDLGDTASIEFSMDIEIPENDSKGSWEKFINTTNDVHNIITKLQTSENNIDAEKFNQFYTEIAKLGYEKIMDEDVQTSKNSHNINDSNNTPKINTWPLELLTRIREQMYTYDNTNMDDIVEFEKHIDNKNKNISDVNDYINT